MHSIDAPSLALLVPILGRALRDRGADLKRKASAITGNMVSMVSEPKTLVPYLVQVLPGLQDCLLDPIPGEWSIVSSLPLYLSFSFPLFSLFHPIPLFNPTLIKLTPSGS
jgi:hypothetical protein